MCLSLAVCAAPRSGSSENNTPPVFTKDVAPILQKHCVECHRPGAIAPMALRTYDEVRPWAKSIREQVRGRIMPPWHADSSVREYLNDRSLSQHEIDCIVNWVDSGARRGNPKDMPPLKEFPEGWQQGEPDLVVRMDNPYVVQARETDENHCFCFDPGFEEDKWVTGIEVQPGNREVVHHLAIFIDEDRVSDALDQADPGVGYGCFGSPGFRAYILGGWAPGAPLKHYPEGAATLIPAGSKLVMQVHYHNEGDQTTDQTAFGLYFADEPVKMAYKDDFIAGHELHIPPGDPNYVVTESRVINQDITIHSVAPHMHLLGKRMDMWITRPDGKRIDLVSVPRYDFYWQTEYVLADPVKAPKGTTFTIQGVYDNTVDNPDQPSIPPKPVKFGESTTDEMCVGVYHYTVDGESPEMAVMDKEEKKKDGVTVEDVMNMLDKNGDGKITKDEAPERLQQNFAFVDTNKDGVLTASEVGIIAQAMSQMDPAELDDE